MSKHDDKVRHDMGVSDQIVKILETHLRPHIEVIHHSHGVAVYAIVGYETEPMLMRYAKNSDELLAAVSIVPVKSWDLRTTKDSTPEQEEESP